jgi:CheY-like chemotaxis protein
MTCPLSGRRVLVVEDETMVAWLLEDMLADLGCAIVGPAAHVNQALAMLDAEAIDAAVLDINLNGQKSYPVADALAAHPSSFRPAITRIACQTATKVFRCCRSRLTG